MKVREALLEDIGWIAKVNVNSWMTTYKGIISDTVLTKLSVEKRRKEWEWIYNNRKQDEVIFVAVNDDGEIVGFSNGGRNRNAEFDYDGELYAIYLLKEYQRQGLGKLLVSKVVESLRHRGYSSMMVWVLEENPSVKFYTALGGRTFGKKEITRGKDKLIEVAYGWNNLNELKL